MVQNKTLKVSSVLLGVFVMLSCSGKPQKPVEKYGEALTLKEATPISAILKSPESFLGKEVLVEGTVVDVCPNKGCWIEIADPKDGEKIKIKVKDDVIVFPQEARGKMAKAEGEVYAVHLSQEDAINYFQHVAEEKGESFDPASITGPMTIYQIKGIGAEIEKGQ